jgi:hypothetical protein
MDDSTRRSCCSIPPPSPLNCCHRQSRRKHPGSSCPGVLLESSLLTPPVDDNSVCASPPHNDDSSGSPGVSNESEDAVSEPLDFSKKRRRKQQQEQIVPQISVADDASSMLGVDCFPAFPSVPSLFPGPLPPALLACPLPLLGLLMRHAATVSAAAAAAGRTLHGERGVSSGDLIVSSSSDEQLSSVPAPAQDQYACFRQRFLQQLSQQQQQKQQQQQLPHQRQPQQQNEEDLSNSATSPTSSLDLKGLAYLERRKDILSACLFCKEFNFFFFIFCYLFPRRSHKFLTIKRFIILFELVPCMDIQ